jgi:NADH-quinone oxidoreductase subunit J
MDLTLCVFYATSAVLLTAALSVVLVKHPVRAVLSLIVCFVSSAVLWVLLGAEFLALSLIVVYVGAVMVLFLFVVMMLDVDLAALKDGWVRYVGFGILTAGLMMAAIAWVLLSPSQSGYFQTLNNPETFSADYSNVKALGFVLYSRYLYPFEIAGVLLTVAIIAAIALAFRGRKTRQIQNPAEQVLVTKEGRLKLIRNMGQ